MADYKREYEHWKKQKLEDAKLTFNNLMEQTKNLSKSR